MTDRRKMFEITMSQAVQIRKLQEENRQLKRRLEEVQGKLRQLEPKE